MAYKVCLRHANPFHDPKTGQFTFSTVGAVSKGVKSLSDNLPQRIDRYTRKKKAPRKDLSHLSDKELNEILNREQMERRYDEYFNTPVESKGAATLKEILAVAGDVAAVVGPLAVAGVAIYSAAKAKGA